MIKLKCNANSCNKIQKQTLEQLIVFKESIYCANFDGTISFMTFQYPLGKLTVYASGSYVQMLWKLISKGYESSSILYIYLCVWRNCQYEHKTYSLRQFFREEYRCWEKYMTFGKKETLLLESRKRGRTILGGPRVF